MHVVPFPEPEAVFANTPEMSAAEIASLCVQPLLSVDLSAIDPALHGQAHLVHPISKTGFRVGDESQDFHSYYCRTNWIGFQLDDNNRYHLLGDWRYFTSANQPNNPHVRQANQDYAQRKNSGELPNPLVDTLGGEPVDSNWCLESDLFPLEYVVNSDDSLLTYPLTEDGRRFRFVCCIQEFKYIPTGADLALLFFDPATRIALMTYDYT